MQITICSSKTLRIIMESTVPLGKPNHAAAVRIQGPILEVLDQFVDKSRPNQKLLEISSGEGMHAAHFAAHFPHIQYQPSEYDACLIESIEAYRAKANAPNLQPPIVIDVAQPCSEWKNDQGINLVNSAESFDYILNINMIQVSPFECSEGLFWNAARLLKMGGLLITYGPYAIDGIISPESNVKFDASLRKRNPAWGIRDLGVLEKLASDNGIALKHKFDLPANNKCLIWKKEKRSLV